MLTGRDTLVEEARREELLRKARRQRLVAQVADQPARHARLFIALGSILVSLGKTLQAIGPRQSQSDPKYALREIPYKNGL